MGIRDREAAKELFCCLDGVNNKRLRRKWVATLSHCGELVMYVYILLTPAVWTLAGSRRFIYSWEAARRRVAPFYEPRQTNLSCSGALCAIIVHPTGRIHAPLAPVGIGRYGCQVYCIATQWFLFGCHFPVFCTFLQQFLIYGIPCHRRWDNCCLNNSIKPSCSTQLLNCFLTYSTIPPTQK